VVLLVVVGGGGGGCVVGAVLGFLKLILTICSFLDLNPLGSLNFPNCETPLSNCGRVSTGDSVVVVVVVVSSVVVVGDSVVVEGLILNEVLVLPEVLD